MTKHIDFQKLEDEYPNAYFEFALAGCCEPGYDDKPVILANWNNVPQEEYDRLEEGGYSCEWSDEWIQCDDCGKAFRSSPNSYRWEMYGYISEDGDVICGDCIDMPSYLESIENRPRKALTCALLYKHKPIEQYGYELVKDGFENGFYEGQNANPEEILAAALVFNPQGRYVFVIDGQGQFDIDFSLYRRLAE